MNDCHIRPYTASDRQAVRKICCDNADKGGPVDNFFPEREIFADLVAGYYTDYEPGSLWVAVIDNKVVGYLMGCFDSRRFIRIMYMYLVPVIVIRAFLQGVFFRRHTWRILKTSWMSMRLGGFKRNIPLDKYPAHLHINIMDGFRGRHIGKELITVFLRQAKEAGVKGCNISVREDNISARRFFESFGFKLLSRHPMFMPEGKDFKQGATLVYVMAI